MDEAEARRLLALAADDGDRPALPPLWPQLQHARHLTMRRRTAGSAAAATVAAFAIAIVVRRRHQCGDRSKDRHV